MALHLPQVSKLCSASQVTDVAAAQGMGAGEAADVLGVKEPRKSWQMRKRQERAALKEGLAEWQVDSLPTLLKLLGAML